MAKSPLKDKDFIPDDESLQKILGSRWPRYQECLEELKKRNLYPEMYWYGPSSGWAPRFCIGEVTVCGIYLAQNPLMGLVGVGDKVGAYLDNDNRLSQRARALYDQGAIPGGNSRAEFSAFIRAEMTRWAEVIRRANIRAE